RGFFSERLPAVGSGRIRPPIVALATVAMGLLMITTFSNTLLASLIITFSTATVGLSVVVLLGYTGQLSFAQMAMAGLSAMFAAHLVQTWNVPFPLAVLIAIVAAVPIGVIFALPALRSRGVNLAVVTLGLGAAIYYMVFNTTTFAGGTDGYVVGPQSL